MMILPIPLRSKASGDASLSISAQRIYLWSRPGRERPPRRAQSGKGHGGGSRRGMQVSEVGPVRRLKPAATSISQWCAANAGPLEHEAAFRFYFTISAFSSMLNPSRLTNFPRTVIVLAARGARI